MSAPTTPGNGPAIVPKTVANHIAAIFNKLQEADRSQAIILAREAGLGRSAPTP